ncbi:MAG: hypothetical protein ACWA40_07365 [Planktomarina sp.]
MKLFNLAQAKGKMQAVIATVAPTVAAALGGPLAGVATRAVAEKLLDKADADLPAVEAAVAAATGADLVKLKELEAEFKAQMAQAGVDLEQIAAFDRDSARDRQVAMKDWTPTILGTLIIAGFFGALGVLFFYGMPAIGSQVLLVMLGALGTMVSQVGNYFFGSSVGSKNKDQIISDLKGAQG